MLKIPDRFKTESYQIKVISVSARYEKNNGGGYLIKGGNESIDMGTLAKLKTSQL